MFSRHAELVKMDVAWKTETSLSQYCLRQPYSRTRARHPYKENKFDS